MEMILGAYQQPLTQRYSKVVKVEFLFPLVHDVTTNLKETAVEENASGCQNSTICSILFVSKSTELNLPRFSLNPI